jgi:hypothetical protein
MATGGLTVDFRRYYDLEGYLFDQVHPAFVEQGYLLAFDLFCIVIWKANRAKSRVASRLLDHGHQTLDQAVKVLTAGLAERRPAKERLRYLVKEWRISLPMASAILAVLYPDEFTVYDRRVCGLLGDFRDMEHLTDFDHLWSRYEQFRRSVEATGRTEWTLREKDRNLWGQSFYEQLTREIERRFIR